MSTLGFGDITFESDAGRIFSVVVLLSGALFIAGDRRGRGVTRDRLDQNENRVSVLTAWQ